MMVVNQDPRTQTRERLMNKPKLVIFDIDGVLMDSEYRVQLYWDGHVDDYHAAVLDDLPIPAGFELLKVFLNSPKHHVLFVTSRAGEFCHRIATLKQLELFSGYRIHDNQLIMREYPQIEPERLPCEVKKPMMIEAAGYSLDDIVLVFEDDKDIAAMWRNCGIACYLSK